MAGRHRPPAGLARLLADLDSPAPAAATDRGGRSSSWALRLVDRLTGADQTRDRQPALAGIPASVWARDKVLGATVGLTAPLLVWATLAAVGVLLPPVTLLVAGACAAGRFLLPDLRPRDRVDERRRSLRYALSAYLDLVNIILSGGGGIETALVAGADAGDGWAFEELRHALHTAQRINQPLWTAFDDLGARLDVPELRELASSLGLAGSQAPASERRWRSRPTRSAPARSPRPRPLPRRHRERMNIPTAVLLLGFLLFIVFPAVTAITGTTTDSTCLDGSDVAACQTEPPTTTGSAP